MRFVPPALALAMLLVASTGCRTAPAAVSSEELPPLVQHLEQIIENDPADGAAIYVLARFHAERDPDTSIDLLNRLLEIGWDYALDDSDFGSLADRPDYRVIAETLAGREPAVGNAAVAFDLERENVTSEGMAWNPGQEAFHLGSAERRKVLTVDREGEIVDELPHGDDLLLAPLGMELDRARELLWVASAAAPFMSGYEPALAGQSMLTGIALSNGAIVANFEIGSEENPSLLNDLAILPDGRVAVTDSQRDVIWIADHQTGAIEALTDPDELWAPNGIAVAPSGRSLIVTTFPGLFLVDLSSGDVTFVETEPGIRLNGIDGLESSTDALVGIQNVPGRVRIWQLELDEPSKRASALILTSGDDRLENPTTGAIVGDEFFYMANPGAGTGQIRMMRIPLR